MVMSNGLTAKMEAFCQGVIELGNQSAAYRNAYHANGMLQKTIREAASRLAARPAVKARITALQEAAASAAGVTRQVILSGLMTEAETAPEGGTRVTPLMLNERWRVASDDWLQWILEARHGKPGIKSSGWRGRSFCTTRKALLRCIGEYCGEVDQAAVAYIETWPEQYPHRSRFEPSARPDEVSGPVEAAAA